MSETNGVDVVNHPPHYNNYPIEVIRIVELVLENTDLSPLDAYCMGNIIKYRMRAGFKGDVQQDIDKANWYMEFMNARSN